VKKIPPPATLREGADRVADVLRQAGFQAYFAGGCVRDGLLGVPCKDYDITTDATPEQVAKLFRRTIMVGAAFGVVKVVLGKDRDYEVATFRSDGVYSDGRRPDEVAYSKTPKEDVERRDFTINALLMDPRDDSVLDLVGGKEDLEAGRIRAVGEPARRFAEDRLRMLRAVRFAARFGFEVEPETWAAIQTHANHLSDVSVERISAELEGIFRSARPGLGFSLIVDGGLLPGALPHAAGRDEAGLARVQDALTRLPDATEGVDPSERVIVAWALTLEGSSPRAADAALRQMKLSREQMRAVKALLEAQPVLEDMSSPESAAVRRLLAGPDADVLSAFQRALLGPEAAPVQAADAVQADLRDRPLPPRPLLTGADLTKLGMQPGRHFKDLLDAVDDAVLERRITTKDEAIALVRARAPS
jgi:poly(A) polymerase